MLTKVRYCVNEMNKIKMTYPDLAVKEDARVLELCKVTSNNTNQNPDLQSPILRETEGDKEEEKSEINLPPANPESRDKKRLEIGNDSHVGYKTIEVINNSVSMPNEPAGDKKTVDTDKDKLNQESLA